MRRVRITPRDDWQRTADDAGFDFHTINGAPYWDESAYYAFTLRQIEDDIEAPTADLHAMAVDMVQDIVTSEAMMTRLSRVTQ